MPVKRVTIVLSAACLGLAATPGRAGAPAPERRWTTWGSAGGLPDERILSLHVFEHRLWVGTAGGLACRADGGWRAWTEADGLPSPAVTAIAGDGRSGDLWLGTWGGGLVRLTAGRFDVYDQLNSGLAGNLVFAVAVDGPRVWAATSAGLSALDVGTGTWTLFFERRADAPEHAFLDLVHDGKRLHAAAWCGDLHVLDGGRRSALPPPPGRSRGASLAAGGAAGTLWWLTVEGLQQRDASGRWRKVARPAGGGPAAPVYDLAVRGDAVSLATDHGVEVLGDSADGTWTTYRRGVPTGGEVVVACAREVLAVRAAPTGLPDDRVRCVCFEGDNLWVGTVAGLACGTRRGSAPGPPPRAGAAGPALQDGPAPPAVAIGVLRPGDRVISIAGAREPGVPRLGRIDRLAVVLAVEQANERGGFRGRVPFAVATGPTGAFKGWGWTTPEDDFPALAERPDVRGIVAYLGPGSRFTTAVALRSEVAVVNAAATPPTVDEALNPWISRPPRAAGAAEAARFEEAYRRRFGRKPPPGAHDAFRAAEHLLAAIERAGLDRSAVRRELAVRGEARR